MEFPRYINLDFLLVILGLIFLGFPIYFLIIKPLQNFNVLIGLIMLMFIFVGIVFFLLGFSEMLKNYTRETNIIKLESHVKEIKLKKELDELKNKNEVKTNEREV